MAIKIVIVVEGGVVQSVYSDWQETNVILIDHDNLRAEGLDSDAREAAENEARQGTTEVGVG